MKTIIAAALATLALTAAAGAQTLTATSTVTPVGAFYNYDYVFSITGPAGTAVDNLFLSSDDLSPVGPFSYLKNGAATSDWSFASNDTPNNYLDFFSASDSLRNGDSLDVKFTSAYAPTPTGFANGYDTLNGRYTANTVTGLAAPVPEMSTAPLLALGGLWIGFAAYRRRRA